MASKHSRMLKGVPASGVDNFKQISGIGPGVESRLYNAGIHTYAQLASMTSADIAALVTDLAGLSAERIAKYDWIGQARLLARETPAAADIDITTSHHTPESSSIHTLDAQTETIPHEGITIPLNRQHYATFTVELLLEPSKAVRRTMITHIQSGVRDAWAGWDHRRLLTCITQYGELNTLNDTSDAYSTICDETVVTKELASVSDAQFHPLPRLREFVVCTATDAQPRSILRRGEAFCVRCVFDVEPQELTDMAPLVYDVSILARSLDNRSRYTIAETSGILTATDLLSIDGIQLALDSGIYRLEAAIMLQTLAENAEPGNTYTTFLEGNLLHIY